MGSPSCSHTNRPPRPCCRWLWRVVLCLGLVLGPLTARTSAISITKVNLQRLRHIREALQNLEDMVDNLGADMEKQVNRESQNELLERHQYPISEKRHVSDRFSAVRGKRPYDRPSIPDDVINDALHIRSSDTEEYTTPEDEDEVKMLSRAKADDNTFEDYRKRDPSAGFSPARGKRLPLRADDIPYKRPSSAADFSYKRGPPQGFSSVRGKRPSSYLSDKRAPPGGFSSVRGKRRMAYHDRRSEQTTFGNPFFRLVLSDPDEPPKRTPPSGFSFARGKKDARDDLYDLGMRASRERVPRQDYYKSMVNRLMSEMSH